MQTPWAGTVESSGPFFNLGQALNCLLYNTFVKIVTQSVWTNCSLNYYRIIRCMCFKPKPHKDFCLWNFANLVSNWTFPKWIQADFMTGFQTTLYCWRYWVWLPFSACLLGTSMCTLPSKAKWASAMSRASHCLPFWQPWGSQGCWCCWCWGWGQDRLSQQTPCWTSMPAKGDWWPCC